MHPLLEFHIRKVYIVVVFIVVASKLALAFRMRKAKQTPDLTGDWSTTGTFLRKPAGGWLHEDRELQNGLSVNYSVQVPRPWGAELVFGYIQGRGQWYGLFTSLLSDLK